MILCDSNTLRAYPPTRLYALSVFDPPPNSRDAPMSSLQGADPWDPMGPIKTPPPQGPKGPKGGVGRAQRAMVAQRAKGA